MHKPKSAHCATAGHDRAADRAAAFEFHHEQRYFFEVSAALKVPHRVVRHDRATSTCGEKAALLGWDVERMVKAVFFSCDGKVIGVVLPDIGKIDQKRLFHAALGMPAKQAKRFVCGGFVPAGMEAGTCTPFPRESSMGKDIQKIVVIDYPKIDHQLVDISVGGLGDDAHKVSVHIPYGGIYRILRHRFGESIVRAPLHSGGSHASHNHGLDHVTRC
jgi:hypothetical protein